MNKAAFAKKHLLARSWLSYLLLPASLAYASYMRVRRRLLFAKGYKSSCKVISVGNLSIGGSGKTPVSIALALALKARGKSVLYSSRGYKSALEEGATLISDGKRAKPSQNAGDEALEAAFALRDIPVICGKDRLRALKMAEDMLIDFVVLDDSFQHHKVQRDLDILVFDSESGLGNGFCLPSGYLRESFSAIHSGALCILHHKPQNVPDARLLKKLNRHCSQLFEVSSHSDTLIHRGEEVSAQDLAGKKITLLCGIANPQSFIRGAKALGITWQNELIFSDHEDYTLAPIQERIAAQDADYILCTQKDAVKLMPAFESKLLILRLHTFLPDSLVDHILTALTI